MHEHAHPHDPKHSHLDGMDVRVRALETLLTQKGYVDPAALDRIIETYETRVGPHNGAAVVAKAWVDPAFKARFIADPKAACAEMGIDATALNEFVVLENTPKVRHMVVCTLCSCYPRPILGRPPDWYKSFNYRQRSVSDPRGVMREFGLELPDDVEVRVHDSTADIRYIVMPLRPAGTDGWSEEDLAKLVTRDSMIGVMDAMTRLPD